jgi:DNA repair exonuclease SbcCD ATPase subunit
MWMTLDRLRLTNFQCHELLDIQLDPGITTIVGPSDVGKSAVIRALRLLALNKPRGDGYVRFGFKGCEVRAKVDGKTVRRERGGENLYSVDKQVYWAFSNEVPKAVQSVLNLSDANFSGQHDPPFWFSLSPPELARQLNRIVDLDVIDRMTSHLASTMRSLKARQEVVVSRLSEATQAKRKLFWAVLADRGLARLEQEETKTVELRGRIGRLDELVQGIRSAESTANQVVPNLDGLEETKDEIVKRRGSHNRLEQLVGELKETDVGLAEMRIELVNAEKRLEKELGGRCPLCGGKMP